MGSNKPDVISLKPQDLCVVYKRNLNKDNLLMKRKLFSLSLLLSAVTLQAQIPNIPCSDTWEMPGARIMLSRGGYDVVENGIPNQMHLYKYDANGNIIADMVSDLSYGSWAEPQNDEVYTYDNQNRCTVVEQKATSEEGDEWTIWKNTYAYDAKGNITEFVYYSNNNWELDPEYKYTYEYDANNHCTKEWRYVYYLGEKMWQASEKTVYTYNADGNKTKAEFYSGDESSLQMSAYFTYVYNEQKQLEHEAHFYIEYYSQEGTTTEHDRYDYKYDNAGRQIEKLHTTYYQQMWNYYSKETKTYNDKGQLTKIDNYNSDSQTEPVSGERYSYDNDGRVTKIDYWSYESNRPSASREYYYTDNALHEGEFVEGVCGTDENPKALTWKVDGNTLTISGTGAMKDYDDYYLNMPWLVAQMYVKNIVVGEGVTSIGEYAFRGADKVEDIEFSSTVEEIGQGAFRDNIALKKLVLTDNLKTVGRKAFEYCKALENVEFDKGLKVIDEYAFQNCNLKELHFPAEMAAEIKYRAFYYNRGLEYFNIPENTKMAYIVDGENHVKQIDCYAKENPFTERVYYPNALLYVPVGCKADLKYALRYSEFLDILEFGEIYTPNQYVINGVAYDYTDGAKDIYGDGSVIVEGNEVKLCNTVLNGGLSLNFSKATVTASGRCSINGDIHAKDKLLLQGDFDSGVVDVLIVNGGVYCDEPANDVPLEITVPYFAASLPSSASTKGATRAAEDERSVVEGFGYITYNSFYFQMYEPENGYYQNWDGYKLMDSTHNPAKRVIIANQWGVNGINDVSCSKSQVSGKYLENNRIVVRSANGKKYNLVGLELK